MNVCSASALWGHLDPAVWLVTSQAASQRGGLIATFVNRASIVSEMPRVLVGIAKQHHTWELVEASGAFALHLLAEEQLDLVWRFGLQSGRETNKMEGLLLGKGVTGSPLLANVLGWLDCRVEARLDIGDRTVYLAEVLEAEQVHSGAVLTLKRLSEIAPLDKLQELKKLMTRDCEVDAEAIRTWRQNLSKSR